MDTMDEEAKVQRIAYLIHQLASLKENYTSMENELALLKALVNIEPWSVCKHSCVHHMELMDPALCSDFPEEILHKVFARLPLPQLISLECLSREFSKPEFRQLCAAVEPNSKMFALVSKGEDTGDFDIKLLDINSSRWHTFKVTTPHLYFSDTMYAADGRLVCFISKDKNKVLYPLAIIVLNPLTRQWKRLLVHSSLSQIQPVLVQLVVDVDTKSYKVLVVGKEQEVLFGKVYDSATGEWSNTDSMSNLIFGYQFHWDHLDQAELDKFDSDDEEKGVISINSCGPCVFDCPKTQLHNLCEQFLYPPKSHGYSLMNDHLFVLEEEQYEWQARGMDIMEDS